MVTIIGLVIVGVILICLVCFAGKALLAILGFMFECLRCLFSSGCFWWFVGLVVLGLIAISVL